MLQHSAHRLREEGSRHWIPLAQQAKVIRQRLRQNKQVGLRQTRTNARGGRPFECVAPDMLAEDGSRPLSNLRLCQGHSAHLVWISQRVCWREAGCCKSWKSAVEQRATETPEKNISVSACRHVHMPAIVERSGQPAAIALRMSSVSIPELSSNRPNSGVPRERRIS